MCDGSLKPIQHVRAGEFVLSRSEETGEFGCREVVEPYANPDNAIIRIELLALDIVDDGGQVEQITTTAEHPFYRPELGRFVRADELVVGDALLSSSGAWLKVGSATWVQQSATVYNLTIDEFHTYFVGLAGTLVHNTCNNKLPENPDDLLNRGYVETTHPAAGARGHRAFINKETGDALLFDKGVPGKNGWKEKDHYHRFNPNRTNRHDRYLDKHGNPCREGCDPSHLLPGD